MENMDNFNYKTLQYSLENKIARITINRPEALNALNTQVLSELTHCVTFLENNYASCQVVILTGAGDKAFVAGADIKEMLAYNPTEARDFSALGSQCFLRLENLPQVVIATINGFALGGGLELALAADFMVATPKSKFGFPEVSLGIIPGFGGTQRLARKIGVSKSIEWITSGEKYNAEDALASGLINKIIAPEDFNSAINKYCENILRNGPQAIKTAKQVIKQGASLPIEAGIKMESLAFGISFNEEAREGFSAFLEKRRPSFTN